MCEVYSEQDKAEDSEPALQGLSWEKLQPFLNVLTPLAWLTPLQGKGW